MPDEHGRMTADEFREALDVLGETQSSFADLLVALGDVGNDKARTVQRWATGQRDIPGGVVALLQALVLVQDYADLTPDDLREMIENADPDDGSVVAAG